MEEKTIIRYAQQGQISYFKPLIKIYEASLYGYCYHLTMNAQDASDLYQDTWVKVMEKIHNYDSKYKFKNWLFKIALNTYRDIYRKKLRRYQKEIGFTDTEYMEQVFESISSHITTEEIVMKKEEATSIFNCINQLKPKLREVIVLFYLQEETIKSTSKILGIKEGTVKSRLHTAKKKLEEMLEVKP